MPDTPLSPTPALHAFATQLVASFDARLKAAHGAGNGEYGVRLVEEALMALTNPQYSLAGEVLAEIEDARRRREVDERE